MESQSLVFDNVDDIVSSFGNGGFGKLRKILAKVREQIDEVSATERDRLIGVLDAIERSTDRGSIAPEDAFKQIVIILHNIFTLDDNERFLASLVFEDYHIWMAEGASRN